MKKTISKPTDFKAVMFLSSALGSLDLLKDHEPAKHTKRYRMITKVEKLIMELYYLYEDGFNDVNDLIEVGIKFHTKMDVELDKLIKELTVITKDS